MEIIKIINNKAIKVFNNMYNNMIFTMGARQDCKT